MPLVLTEEQQLLRETAREFLAEKSPVAEHRRLRDERDSSGYATALWTEMAELGWAGVPFPEEVGGAGLGWTELGVLLEQCGRTLASSPLVSTVLASGAALLGASNEALRKERLTQIASGGCVVGLALDEQPRFDASRVATRAEPDGTGYRIRGRKTFVLDGGRADRLIVAARVSGSETDRDGVALFEVDADAPGIARTPLTLVDARAAAKVDFDGVEVGPEGFLGTPGGDAQLLERVVDVAAAGVAAEMLGAMDAAFEMTLQFLKDRTQFGVPIGSFQALKHRAARMFVARELSRTTVLQALQALDANDADASRLASLAKAQCSDALQQIANEGVQMHGGLGVTDEQDIGLFLKRGRVLQRMFGDAAFHRDRYATLGGY